MLQIPIAEKASRLVIQTIDPLRQEEWNCRLQTHADASFFHTAEWARVLNETYGHKPVYFSALDNGRLFGLLAVVEVCSRMTGRRGVSLAFTDSCPPLTSPGVPCEELLEHVLDYGRVSGWKYFEARAWPCQETGVSPSLSFWGHVLELEVGEKALYSRLQSEVRTAIRKAEKSGVRIELLKSEAAMESYYRLHRITRNRHGLPPQPYAFFRKIQQAVIAKGLGFVAVASYEGRPISAAVFLHFGKKAIYKFGASDKGFQKLRANTLLMWEVIKDLVQRGFVSLDFGRSSLSEEGLCRFKRGFGAAEHRMDYMKYDFSRQAFVQDTDAAEGWHNHIFRLMPLPVARMAGTILYPHLS